MSREKEEDDIEDEELKDDEDIYMPESREREKVQEHESE